MCKLWCVILFTTTAWSLTSGSKLETIKKCCSLGTNYGNSGLKCSTFQPPVAGVSKEDESLCLNSVDVCCKQVYRDKQCKLGQTDAMSISDCANLSNDLDGFRKDCCEACKLGLEAGSSGQSCSADFGLGDLMVSAYKACCNNKLSTSTLPPTLNITLSTFPTTTPIITTTEEYPISSEKYDINNPPPPPSLEALCDIPDLCAHLCIPTEDSYKCDCHPGYTLMPDGISCKPSKIPSSNLQRCETHNPCDHNCIDTGVAIKCTCRDGYELDDDKKTCVDIDECDLNIHDCDDSTVCVNQIGDYDCIKESDLSESEENKKNCPLGYAYDRDQMLCNDIDECKIGRKCPKPNICINTIGSYTCSDVTPTPVTPKCPPGFYFKASILSCSDIDECVNGKNDCNRESQICLNTIGNYTCIDKASKKLCPPGFKKNIILQECEDINECEENEQACFENEDCVNQPGGHNCIPKLTTTSTSTIATTKSSDQPSTLFYGLPAIQPTKPYFNSEPSTEKPSTLTVVQTKSTSSVYPSISTRSQPAQPQQRSNPPPHVNVPFYPGYNPQDQFVTCSTGYTYSDVTKTCADINECEQEVCDSNQNCYNTIGSYQCGCKEGFTKDFHTGACIDINECQIGSNECGEGQRCDNTIGSYVCSRTTGCGTGYTLNSASGLCEDDDECILGMHNCLELGPKFQCRNTLGSYRCERIKCIGDCYYKKYTTTTRYIPTATVRETTKVHPVVHQFKQCLPGYQMNQLGVCEDIDDCSSNPCKRNEKCYNLSGRHQCVPLLQCRAGYELNESGTECNDINECTRGTHKCSGTQLCKNGPGYYLCQCPPGHKLNSNNDCEDINECELYRDWRCSRNARCLNTIGSYICECKEGFRENGQTCDDINECAETPHLCHQNCVNLWGSYRCSCERGFTLNIDNRTCTDIDECEKFKNKNLCVGSCQNTPGSYMCMCPEGYRKGLDGRTCQDVDECAGDVCRNADDVCVNTRGGYKCHTIICPPNYIKDPEHKSRCKRASNVCDIRDINCIRMPGQYSYHFVTFVSNLPLPDEGRIDFFQMKGPAWISSHANFNMNVRNIRCPRHIVQADESFFRMKRDSNKVVVSLTKSIEGPQEIELELQLELYISGAFQGKVVSTVFVYVSEYTF